METQDPAWADPALAQQSDWVRYRPLALPGLTLMRAHFTDHSFERHSHAEYGIGLTYSGLQTFNAGGAKQTSTRGNVIFLNPDLAHDGLPGEDGAYRYSMLYVDPDLMASVRERAAGTLASGYFRNVVVHAPQAARRLHDAIESAAQAQESLRSETLLINALVQLLSQYGEAPAPAQAPLGAGQSRLRRVREYIHMHADCDITINELARVAGVSRVYLSRAFQRQFGVPPHIYLNAVRLANARRLLLAGVPLAAVAAAAGFADQSHFSRRFKGAVGVAPGEWLRQMRQD